MGGGKIATRENNKNEKNRDRGWPKTTRVGRIWNLKGSWRRLPAIPTGRIVEAKVQRAFGQEHAAI